MGEFTELLNELDLQGRRGSAGGGRGAGNPATNRARSSIGQFRPTHRDPNFAKAIAADLTTIQKMQAANMRAMVADSYANLRDRQRELVTQGRAILMKAALDGTMTAIEVATAEGLLHRHVSRAGL